MPRENASKAAKWTESEKARVFFNIIEAAGSINWSVVQIPEGRTLKAVRCMIDTEKKKIKASTAEDGSGNKAAATTPDSATTPGDDAGNAAVGTPAVPATPTKRKRATKPKAKKSEAYVQESVEDEEKEEGNAPKKARARAKKPVVKKEQANTGKKENEEDSNANKEGDTSEVEVKDYSDDLDLGDDMKWTA